MFLHNDKELFQEVIVSAAEDLDLVVPIVEKDYYVTMILKKLSIWCPECVFQPMMTEILLSQRNLTFQSFRLLPIMVA